MTVLASASMLYALCSMLCTLCSVLCALCSVLYEYVIIFHIIRYYVIMLLCCIFVIIFKYIYFCICCMLYMLFKQRPQHLRAVLSTFPSSFGNSKQSSAQSCMLYAFLNLGIQKKFVREIAVTASIQKYMLL
jgi:hypothetical protein